MNPKKFLLAANAILIITAALGFLGIIGPTPDKSVFGVNWWFNNVENWTHLVIGLVALVGAFALPAKFQRILVILIGVLAVIVGLWSLLISSSFLGTNLENPADTIFHLALGAWALISARGKKLE